MSPARYLQEHGGIEGIIQEAAKGVSDRGEKWGVAKALRGAYEGLQSAGSTPRRLGSVPRWSLETGDVTKDDMARLTTRVENLERRNMDLAKLLGKALEDLWAQQHDLSKANSSAAADALSVAIAKVQFVQVYLENPTMPLPTEEASQDNDDETLATDRVSTTDLGSPTRKPTRGQSPTRRAPVKEGRRKSKADGQGSSLVSPKSPSKAANASIAQIDPIPALKLPQSISDSPTSPRSRPALAQSSFSWMLGQEQRISEFVAASPFSTESERARGKTGFLFGGDEAGNGKESSPIRKGKKGGSSVKEGEDADESITLANIDSDTHRI